jgi:two-component system CheB/CheR fusion protein
VTDLSRANNDMNNLLAGTGIATVFVDHQRRILRFTPTAAEIINLIPGDVGPAGGPPGGQPGGLHQPGGRRAGRARHPGHAGGGAADHRGQVVRDAHPALPHAGQRDRGRGADLHGHQRDEAHPGALAAANRQLRLAVVVRDASDAITVQDLEGRITAWNPGAQRLYGWSEDEALQMNVRDRIPAR